MATTIDTRAIPVTDVLIDDLLVKDTIVGTRVVERIRATEVLADGWIRLHYPLVGYSEDYRPSDMVEIVR